MKLMLLAALAAVTLTLEAKAGPAAPGPGLSAAHSARIARFDKGPATIDVSSYPPAAQADYRVFRQKCALCHSPSRPINSDYALPNEWSLYIVRMISKPGSNISANDSRRIYDFLVYDSSVRKIPLLNKKLAELDPAMRTAMLTRIASIKMAYHAKK